MTAPWLLRPVQRPSARELLVAAFDRFWPEEHDVPPGFPWVGAVIERARLRSLWRLRSRGAVRWPAELGRRHPVGFQVLAMMEALGQLPGPAAQEALRRAGGSRGNAPWRREIAETEVAAAQRDLESDRGESEAEG